MEVYASEDAFVLVKGDQRLRIARGQEGQVEQLKGDSGPVPGECLGRAEAVLGVLKAEECDQLLLVEESSLVGFHPHSGAPVQLVVRLAALPLDGSPPTAPLPPLHPVTLSSPVTEKDEPPPEPQPSTSAPGFSLLQKSQAKLSAGFAKLQKPLAKPVAASPLAEAPPISEAALTERRILEELLRMFNDAPSFYYAEEGGDLTRSMSDALSDDKDQGPNSAWMWNWELSSDLRGTPWEVRLIHGFVGTRRWVEEESGAELSLTLISRRSRHRAGTRYIKRGMDREARVANCVETEQLLHFQGHTLAFVQLRGSVPLFWAQPGYRYRPPPRLTADKARSLPAFAQHLQRCQAAYGSPLVLVNLVNQAGSEHLIGSAFLDHVLAADLPDVVYAAFDFHEHCKALRFQNVDRLIAALEEPLHNVKFTWASGRDQPAMCRQKGVLRLNCMDCLDRTNVVEMWVGKGVLRNQLHKLGVLSPEAELSAALLKNLHELWADNGDAISRQYAGTAALKGDYTRSGTRNLAGVLRDGVNSASRYYLCHVRDATRQAAIDLLLGQEPEHKQQSQVEEAEEAEEEAESLRVLVEEWQRFFLPEDESLLGAWALVGAEGEWAGEDVLLLLTKHALYLGEYCEETDKVTDSIRLPLAEVSGLQAGPLLSQSWTSRKPTAVYCLRVLSRGGGKGAAKAITLRAGRTRLFNNLALVMKSPAEGEEYLRSIGEQVKVAMAEWSEAPPRLDVLPKLERSEGRLNSLLSGVAGAGGDALRGALKGAGAIKTRLVPASQTNSVPKIALTSPSDGLTLSPADSCPSQLRGSAQQLHCQDGRAESADEASSASRAAKKDVLCTSHSDTGLMEKIGDGLGKLSTQKTKIKQHPFQEHLARIPNSKSTVILL